MRRKYNLILDLLDDCRVSGDKKFALALYLGIKFAYANSRLYDISVTGIMRFYHCSYKKAVKALEIFKTDTKLFTYYDESQFVKANCLKSDEVRYGKKDDKYEFTGNSVCKLDIPKCYANKQTLSIKDLLAIIKRVLIQKEYDDGSGYKLSDSTDGETSGSEKHKSQLRVSKRTGYSRATVGRVMNEDVKAGIFTKTDKHLERTDAHDPHGFKAINKKTRLPYFLKSKPTIYTKAKNNGMLFTFVIWNCSVRKDAPTGKSENAIKRKVSRKAKKKGETLTPDEFELRCMAERYFEGIRQQECNGKC